MTNTNPPAWAILAANQISDDVAYYETFYDQRAALTIVEHAPDAEALASALEMCLSIINRGEFPHTHESAMSALSAYRAQHPKATP